MHHAGLRSGPAGNESLITKTHVLIIEDESRIAGLLDRGLREEGFTTEVAPDIASAMRSVDDAHVVLLDPDVPDCDGVELVIDLRHAGVRQPILIVSGSDAVDDRVDGLDSGADDFIGQPFAVSEVAARIRARLRASAEATTLSVNGITLDLRTRTATFGEVEAQLSGKESALLEALMLTPDAAVGREELSAQVWGAGGSSSNVVSVYVRYLRKKLGKHAVATARGVGYRIGGLRQPG